MQIGSYPVLLSHVIDFVEAYRSLLMQNGIKISSSELAANYDPQNFDIIYKLTRYEFTNSLRSRMQESLGTCTFLSMVCRYLKVHLRIIEAIIKLTINSS